MLKGVLYIIVFLFVNYCNAQNSGGCNVVETTIIKIKDSLDKVFVVGELEPFSINDYNEFRKKFQDWASDDILKKAYLQSKAKRNFKLDECLLKGLLVSKEEADSLRALNKAFSGNDRALNDSLNRVLNEIFAIANKTEREEKYNAFVLSEPYKKVVSEMESSTNRVVLIGQPIIVENRYVFFTLFLGDRSRHFISSIYFYKKQGTKWHLVKEDTWN